MASASGRFEPIPEGLRVAMYSAVGGWGPYTPRAGSAEGERVTCRSAGGAAQPDFATERARKGSCGALATLFQPHETLGQEAATAEI
jgi:hypothetical protein